MARCTSRAGSDGHDRSPSLLPLEPFPTAPDTRASTPHIRLHGLGKRYPGGVQALREIDLEIRRGEVFGIIGRSGAGKSSLIRTLNRLERPSEGQVLIDDEDIGGYDGQRLVALRRRIGMIFQHFNLMSAKTVWQNIALPRGWPGCPGHGSRSGSPGCCNWSVWRKTRRLSGAALRRAETARRHRPRAGAPAADTALRRSHLGAGPGEHPGDPRAAARHQPPAGPDHRPDHPRDGGHPRDLRPRGGPRMRPHRRTGRSLGSLRRSAPCRHPKPARQPARRPSRPTSRRACARLPAPATRCCSISSTPAPADGCRTCWPSPGPSASASTCSTAA